MVVDESSVLTESLNHWYQTLESKLKIGVVWVCGFYIVLAITLMPISILIKKQLPKITFQMHKYQ